MLVPMLVYRVLFYGALVVAGLALLVWRSLPRTPSRSRALPTASVVVSPWRRLGQRLLRWSPPLTMLGGAVAAFLIHGLAHEVIVVRDDGGQVDATRKIYLGGAPHYGSAPATDDPYQFTDPTWVVNESSRPVRVVHYVYGNAYGLGQDPTEIPAGDAARFNQVDNIGPGDPPPQTITDSTGLKMGFREWLTWSDPPPAVDE